MLFITFQSKMPQFPISPPCSFSLRGVEIKVIHFVLWYFPYVISSLKFSNNTELIKATGRI